MFETMRKNITKRAIYRALFLATALAAAITYIVFGAAGLFDFGLVVGVAVLAFAVMAIYKARNKWLPELHELVELDSRGWFFLAVISTITAFVLILSSQAFGMAYWVGYAIDTDGTPPGLGWKDYISITTVSFATLSIVFEWVADLGAPLASGLKKEKKKGVPELLLVCAAFCIVASLVSKWGYYEDKRNASLEDAMKIVMEDNSAQRKLDEAIATIDQFKNAPTVAVAEAKEKSIDKQIADITDARRRAQTSHDALPSDHSSNRIKYQQIIDGHTATLAALEAEKIEAVTIRENAAKLAQAQIDKAAAEKTLADHAGKTEQTETGQKERRKTGDMLFVRVLRVGLHQVLCFLMTIIAIDAFTVHRRVKTREKAAQRGAETRRRNRAKYDAEGDFDEVDLEPGSIEGPPPIIIGYAEDEPGEDPEQTEEGEDDVANS